MKRIKIAFIVSFSVFAIITACRKDPKPGKQVATGGVYNPTYIDPAKYFPARLGIPNIPADNPLTVEGMYLGRMLFYDPVLSFDSSVSCASCHDQKHAFADPNGGKVSTGIFGLKTSRNAPGIFNAAYSRTFFWDARQHTLREQLFEPIQSHQEMAMTLPLLEKKLARIDRYKTAFKKAFNAAPDVFYMSLAIEQFEMGIVSSNSKYNDFFPGKFGVLTAEEGEGVRLIGTFFSDTSVYPRIGADCSHCHGGPWAQNNSPNNGGIANNGLDPVTVDKGVGGITGFSYDMGTFKTMSLLNIAVTGPYMHDGRYKTLDQVINFYSDSIHFDSPNLHGFFTATHGKARLRLTAQQKASVKAILMAMTDNVLLNNPDYSNPFK